MVLRGSYAALVEFLLGDMVCTVLDKLNYVKLFVVFISDENI